MDLQLTSCWVKEEEQRLLKKTMERELKTVGIIIGIYCRYHLGTDKYCKSCRAGGKRTKHSVYSAMFKKTNDGLKFRRVVPLVG